MSMQTSTEIIQEIEAMRVKGAYLNAVQALEALRLLAVEEKNLPATELRRKVLEASNRLATANLSWSVVETACRFATQPLRETGLDYSSEEIARLIARRGEAFTDRMTWAQQEVGRVGANLIRDGSIVLVMSYSSTLIEILGTAWEGGKRFSVIGTESRPKGEGRVMAEILVEKGIPFTLITDPAQAYFVPRGTIALVGVDTLVASGAVVNKVGTMNLALACRYYGKPIYAATSTFKMSVPSLRGEAVSLKVVQDTGDIAPERLLVKPNLKVENIFFEETPAELFDGLITEYGIYHPAAAHDLWQRTWQSLRKDVGD
jgi:translation initiation factor 2B subunit (eIF-2B alpha/beta/delta family)